MGFFKKYGTVLYFLIVVYRPVKAQLYTNLGSYHNQFFVGAGYSESFANINYGINHSRYFKLLKRDIVGILDFSSPLSDKYFTRFIVRKGFQIDVYKKSRFRVPVSLITSSVKKHLLLVNLHDLITDIMVMPGIYTDKYTIAADVSLKFVLFQRAHYSQGYNAQPGVYPIISQTHKFNTSAGLILAYNFKRFSFIGRAGFQQISYWEFAQMPIYVVGIIAFKLNFKKHRSQTN